jgi:hypothetical protein
MKMKIALFLILLASYSVIVYAKTDASQDLVTDPVIQRDFNLLGTLDGAKKLSIDSHGQIDIQQAEAMQRLKVADACSNHPPVKEISPTTRRVYLGLCKLMAEPAPAVQVLLPTQQSSTH